MKHFLLGHVINTVRGKTEGLFVFYFGANKMGLIQKIAFKKTQARHIRKEKEEG